MENKRPKIKIPMAPVDIIIEILCIGAMAGAVIFSINTFRNLPQIIPTHFNAAGEIDGHGSRSTIFLLLPVIVIMYAGLTILGRFPQIYNYAVEITMDNARRQYTMARRFIGTLKLEIVITFSYLEYAIVVSALNNRFALGIWFLPLTLIAVFGTIGFYICRSVKTNQQRS